MEFQRTTHQRKAIKAEAHTAFLNGGTRQWGLSHIRNGGHFSAQSRRVFRWGEGLHQRVLVWDYGEKDAWRRQLRSSLNQSQPIKSYGSQKWVHLNVHPTLNYWGKAAQQRCGLGANAQQISKSTQWGPHLVTLPMWDAFSWQPQFSLPKQKSWGSKTPT